MFARVARYEVRPERVGEAVESFRNAGSGLNELDGFVHGYLLADQDSGGLVTITLWQSRSDAESSGSRAARMRREAVSAVDGAVHSVVEYEVAAEFPAA